MAAFGVAVGNPSIDMINGLNKTTTDPWLTSIRKQLVAAIGNQKDGEASRVIVEDAPVKVLLEPQARIRLEPGSAETWKPHPYRLETPSPVVVMDACWETTTIKPLLKPNGKQLVKASKPGNTSYTKARLTFTQPPYLKGKWAVAWLAGESQGAQSC